MPLGALASGLLSGGISLLGGIGQRERQKDAYQAEREALNGLNRQNIYYTERMNSELRARADAAALVPVVTSQETGPRSTSGGFDAAGFLAATKAIGMNAVSAVRAGMAGLFGTTNESAWWTRTATTGERAMEAALAGQYMPSLVSDFPGSPFPSNGLEVASSALSAGFSTYSEMAGQERQNQFQRETLGMSLAARSSTRSSGFSGGATRLLQSGPLRQQGGGEVAKQTSAVEAWLATIGKVPDVIGLGISAEEIRKRGWTPETYKALADGFGSTAADAVGAAFLAELAAAESEQRAPELEKALRKQYEDPNSPMSVPWVLKQLQTVLPPGDPGSASPLPELGSPFSQGNSPTYSSPYMQWATPGWGRRLRQRMSQR